MSQAPEDTSSPQRVQALALGIGVVLGAALIVFTTLDGVFTAGRLGLRLGLIAAGALPIVIFIARLLRPGRLTDRNRRAVMMSILGVHALATLYFIPLGALRDSRPIVTIDYPVHYYQAERTREVFWRTFRVERYDPFFMAGYPGGTLFDLDMKAAELFCVLSPLSTARSLKLFILCAYLTIVAGLYWGARMQGFGLEETVVGVICFLAFWHWGRPYAGDFRYAGMFSFVFASHLSFLLVGLLRQFVFGAWIKTFFVLGAFAFLAHATMPLIVAVPFVSLMIVMRRTWTRRRTASLCLWALGVIFINIIWLQPLITHIDEKTATDAYYQLRGFAHVARILGRPTSALAVAMIVLAGIGVRSIAREGRAAVAMPALSGAAFMFVAAVFGTRLPGIRHLEPGRFLFTAMVFLSPLAGSGARWLLWRISERLPERAAARARAATLAIGVAVMLPLSALESKAFYRHTVTTSLAPEVATLFDALTERVTGSGRLLFEDAPARAYGEGHVGALLPLLTGTEQIGGPYPHTFMIHYFTTFSGDVLLGRPLADWSDGDMRDALAWLGVRWILTATEPAAQSFAARAWTEHEWSSGRYTLWRTTYAMSQSYRVRAALNVIEVDLSGREDVVIPYHWMDGLVASEPARIAPVARPPDPVPFVGISPHGASRVRITY